MRALPLLLSALLLLLALPAPAAPPPPEAEAAIRATIARWYEELRKKDEGRPWTVTAPGFIEGSPLWRHVDTGARSLGPRIHVSLAARALRFRWDVEGIRRDESFARVRVWERGYFYASATQTTYENAAATLFVLERQEQDGRWLILAHRSSPQGIPPGKATDPLPDLRALVDATEGKTGDPEADARSSPKF